MAVVRNRLITYVIASGLSMLLTAGWLISPSVIAAEASERESITISPTIGRYEVMPGEIVQGTFTVLNDGTVPYKFKVYAEPYAVTDKTYEQVYDERSARADAFKWITFEQADWNATVRQTIQVPFTMRVPANASPGSHYGVIFAETQPNPDEPKSGVIRKKRIGLTMMVTVKGDVVYEGKVNRIDIPWYQSIAPLETTVELVNSGNSDYLAKTQMRVQNIFNQTVHHSTQENYIFPETTRELEINWDNPRWLGVYKVTLSSSALDKKEQKTQYVVIAPLWFVLLVIIFLGAGTVYAYRHVRDRKRRGAARR